MVSVVDAMRDPALFGESFGGESFAAWRALLGGFYGLPLADEDLATWRSLTGRTEAPQGPHDELWLAVGRRGGKSHAAALVAVYEAAFRDHRPKLARGEVATVMLLAADRKQARTLLRYVRGLVLENPMLRQMVQRETAEGLELTNRAVIEVATASNRSVRGYTLAAAICDEIAFWHAEGANPDVETIAALRPALATLGGKLIALSSPYARRGALWETYRRHYGEEGRVLVAQAPSMTMNPTLPQHVVDDAMREDAARAGAEYLAQFRDDIASFIQPQLIDDATRLRPLVRPRLHKERYFAFCDPSGGGPDEFTLAIGHVELGRIVVDLVEGRGGSPAEIVRHYSDWLEAYGVTHVVGDRYAGRWPRDAFLRWGIRYETAAMDRSALYVETLAALASGRVELPPDEKMRRQFLMLERRTGASGRDVVDHPPGGHDDRANAVAGLVAHADRLGRCVSKTSTVKGMW